MERQQDELIKYFQEEYNQNYKKYSKRLTIEQFTDQTAKQVNAQFQFLSSSSSNKRFEDQKIIPSILQIRGDIMKSVLDNQEYAIFCQAPSKWNSKYFWSICYQQKITKIFMLNKDSYVPSFSQKINLYNFKKKEQVSVALGKNLSEKYSLKDQQQSQVLKEKDPQSIFMYILTKTQFTGWRDGGVPQGQQCEKTFRMLVEEAIELIEKKEMIIVHCLAGIGRTGTFGAVIEAVRCIRKLKNLSLFEIVSKMREDRNYCVQRPGQYTFAHQQASLFP